MFKFKSYDGDEAVWNDGMIDAPSEVMAVIADAPADVHLPPVGPSLPFSVSDPAAVLMLFIMVLGPGEIIMGEEPELDTEIPEGAIA